MLYVLPERLPKASLTGGSAVDPAVVANVMYTNRESVEPPMAGLSIGDYHVGETPVPAAPRMGDYHPYGHGGIMEQQSWCLREALIPGSPQAAQGGAQAYADKDGGLIQPFIMSTDGENSTENTENSSCSSTWAPPGTMHTPDMSMNSHESAALHQRHSDVAFAIQRLAQAGVRLLEDRSDTSTAEGSEKGQKAGSQRPGKARRHRCKRALERASTLEDVAALCQSGQPDSQGSLYMRQLIKGRLGIVTPGDNISGVSMHPDSSRFGGSSSSSASMGRINAISVTAPDPADVPMPANCAPQEYAPASRDEEHRLGEYQQEDLGKPYLVSL
eukprot:TRINITY_DN121310_c0_g1_i1.p1 TRINITY_DN121310_c0_g1~~TRINITY_DN121310_c0_g1_i1.p1  ORF type:complete len:330 (-),score=45.04 TRINITY_DN121310_c0_g1_i1:349-1338(-)